MASLQLQEMQHQLELFTLLHESAVKNCTQKCIAEYREPYLHKGESVCLDRCIAKFVGGNKLIMEKMVEMQQQQQPQ